MLIKFNRVICLLGFILFALNPRERIGFAELSRLGGIGSPLLAAESASIKNLP
jgi:hypothetical protein